MSDQTFDDGVLTEYTEFKRIEDGKSVLYRVETWLMHSGENRVVALRDGARIRAFTTCNIERAEEMHDKWGGGKGFPPW